MRTISRILILLLVSLILMTVVFQAMAVAQTPNTATISGRVTYNGSYQDNVTVALVGGSSDTTKNGGYYTLTAVPNIAVTMRASYQDKQQTKTIDVGGAGTTTTVNFDLAALPSPTTIAIAEKDKTVTLIGSVKYKGDPVMGIPVNVSPIGTATTDASGQYRIMVPSKMNLTITAETAVGKDTKTVLTGNDGETMIVSLALGEPSATVQATPVATLAPTATNVSATTTPVASPVTEIPTEAPTSVPATPTPAASGSESLIILSVLGLLAIAGLKLKQG